MERKARTTSWLAVAAVAAVALLPPGGEAGPAGEGAAAAVPEAERRASPLTEPGDAAFAAVAEVVRELSSRPDTDWSRVDLEALRRHLRDMRLFTLEAEVEEREEVPGGLRVTVTGAGPEASRAVRRALRAHAPMLEREYGWDADVGVRGERTILTVTSDRAGDVGTIRGLGYIGLMASGAHHRRHHWMIATGRSPHAGSVGPGHARAEGRAAGGGGRSGVTP